MKYFLTQIFLLFFLFLSSFGQRNKNNFFIKGYTNVDTGSIELSTDFKEYAPKNFKTKIVKINNGKFTISGIIQSPIGVRLLLNEQYRSDVFVIEKGTQSATFIISANEKKLTVINNAMKDKKRWEEWTKEYEEMNKKYDQKYDSLNKKYQRAIPEGEKVQMQMELNNLYKKNDSLLFSFVKINPNSSFAFWKFVNLFTFGYENIFDSIYNRFSSNLKNSYAGVLLKMNLQKAAVLAIGKKFSFPEVYNNIDTSKSFIKLSSSKYTLVDFWYSYCRPCIAEFEKLKPVFEKHKDTKLDVISISTDVEKDKSNWLKTIEKYTLPWQQFWDKDGKQASQYYIRAFPTNFLLDKNGVIIRKNVKPAELNKFLNEND